MTLDEIQKEIDRLNTIKRELEEKDQECYDAKATKFVGKCYRSARGEVFKILAIPQKIYCGDFRWHYKEHYFPVLYLHHTLLSEPLEDFVPCYCDEIYFDINRLDVPLYTTEITQEEFNAEFDKCIAHFKEQLNV